ncbi:MAG TPA: malonic semialdehyde reductase [Erythrobacter sp.]|uniref:Putative NADH dehydrogenase/NAD(P)H nitroreductase J121_2656 n=1 Tax=Qipengyuania citrea LAMA 915 TaxID=1306953 RepID=A0A0L1KEQ4_9SPHN|nr:malonic semialdehyde reductase [Qipengyuania citrea]KNH02406.1 malonic semialdehyde reductase [Qipengyuania citrea LAMA 915]HCJ22675.1 malonic semialdehyde reductase [Erythrobacter sp.]
MADTLSADALDLIFREARSYNDWLDQPVSDDEIHAIYELLKMAPTSANMQPARIVWAKSPEAKAKLADCASDGNKDKITSAPVVAIIGYDIDFHEELPWLFPHTDAKSWFDGDEDGRKEGAFRNSSLQGAYLMIAARALGLDCGPMSGFDSEAVNKAFFADQPRHRSNFICAIGHGDPKSIFDRSPRPDFDKFNRID